MADRPDTRERILRAAAQLFGEDTSAALSVRAVAARAAVSMGSLRHHFPTQRELRDAVLERVYDVVVVDDPMRDPAVPARDRLVSGLAQLLAPVGVGWQARESARLTYEKFVLAEQTDEVRTAYLAVEQAARRRIEYWLTTLAKEGFVAVEDVDRHVTFLVTVLNGLAIERALPRERSSLHDETHTLRAAADYVVSRK